jgi:ABC-type branched-subunit amino acid transport system substrate-binding protein
MKSLSSTHRIVVAVARCASAVLLAGLANAALAQEPWVVGQSAPLTGGNAAMGRDIRDGAMAYFKTVNARGGVAGRPIELVTLDDANDRKAAGANAYKLLTERRPVALFGFASATLSLDAMPQAEKGGVLFFAPLSGADPVRKAPPVVYTMRASYGEEMEKILAFWTGLGMKKVVVVHYDDEVGKQNFAVVAQYLSKHNGVAPAALSLKRNQAVEDAHIDQLREAKPDVIINTTLSGAAAEISKRLAKRGTFVPMSSLSFVGAQQYIDAAGESSAGVSIAQVVPNPSSSIPVVRECAKALADLGVTRPMNSTHLEACIGAKVLVEAMRRAKKPGDPAAVLAAMASMGSYDTGGFIVNYGGGRRHGSSYVELGMVTRDGKLRG